MITQTQKTIKDIGIWVTDSGEHEGHWTWIYQDATTNPTAQDNDTCSEEKDEASYSPKHHYADDSKQKLGYAFPRGRPKRCKGCGADLRDVGEAVDGLCADCFEKEKKQHSHDRHDRQPRAAYPIEEDKRIREFNRDHHYRLCGGWQPESCPGPNMDENDNMIHDSTPHGLFA